jgi:uncharacterized membrane protein YphA (DoxX/SURF4 family)
MNIRNLLLWVLRIVPAVILLQTLFFKFTAHPQSVKLFTAIGMEPWGRIGTGVAELIAAILLLVPRFTVLGALLGLGLMSGALYFHFTGIGIKFDGDYVLFIYAVVTFICCLVLLVILRNTKLKDILPSSVKGN